ncbi:Penicillin-binding protein 4 precursor [Metalysinibacillus saudimassiliensis]|uniref:Penicillin-binding protein 4 n=1 Tax=Metalysinibacillus saudimassiliensis TaxID=1461583 RepID=A0A078MGQ9_9BACL|nr:Penicillin-binding protein 4 precursor [Metalysinibacillus saudimassiliensis]
MKDWIAKVNNRIEQLFEKPWMAKVRISSAITWNLALLLLVIAMVGGVFTFSVGAGYFASLVSKEPLRTEKEMRDLVFNYEETSEMYFADNIYIGNIRTDLDRRETSIDKVSPFVVNAVLATEDEYFREHDGIVPKALIRGVLQDVLNSANQTGGSTLTQQLVKNQILTNEVSYERKAKEILLAMRLEHFMTKEEILEAYLNVIPYGRNASGRNIAGIETAAQGVFGVSAADLSLEQAAFLSGIPQNPFTFTPFTNLGTVKSEEYLADGLARMKTVLNRMLETGYITKEEHKKALAYDITKDFTTPQQRPEDVYPWLTYEIERRAKEVVAGMLAEQDQIDPARLKEEENLRDKYMLLADREIRSKGYRIHSTVKKDMYDAMQKITKDYQYYGQTYSQTVKDPQSGEDVELQQPVQTGSVLIENKTGRILSFVGGRDFAIEELNHATQAYRSNGSTMKPLLVYGPAIEYGKIGAGSPLVDVKFNLRGYTPGNYTSSYEAGLVPAREALAQSLNLSALRLYYSILDQRPASFLEKMGFSKITAEDRENLATGIGGLKYGTTVEENTNAFATFANGGQYVESYIIEKIEDPTGNVVYQHESVAEPVFSPETAYIMTDMMRDVLNNGTGQSAKQNLKFGYQFSGKTGTSEEYKDVWFVGYNSAVTLGVWMGYDQPRSLYTFNNTYMQPSKRINLLWATLMNGVYDTHPDWAAPKQGFVKPQNVIYASFCGMSGMAPSNACANAGLVRSDLFNAKVFLPSKADDSMSSSAVVLINGTYYTALANTPGEFVRRSGGGLNPEFVRRMLGPLGGDPSRLVPKGSTLSSGGAAVSFPVNGVAPAAPSASISGNTLSWSRSASNDVVGYRIYNVSGGGQSLVASIPEAGPYSMTVGAGGAYIVVAVNIEGLSSGASNTATAAPVAPPPVQQPSAPEQPTENEPTEPDEQPSQPAEPEPEQPAEPAEDSTE